MYEDSNYWDKPDNINAKIWRFMDFTKFVSLISGRSLFFPNINALQEGDPFEGSYPRGMFDKVKSNIPKAKLGKIPERTEFLKEFVFVNCWHMSEFESFLMWKTYCNSNEGVAIQSTFKRLCDSISDDEEMQVTVGRVEYIDFSSWSSSNYLINNPHPAAPFMVKRQQFRDEREVRAIAGEITEGILTDDWEELMKPFSQANFPKKGIPIRVDLATLVEKIYVSPRALSWFHDIVKEIIDKYELNFEVLQSSIDTN